MQLVVHYPDGSSYQMVTDGSWQVLAGAWFPGTQRDLEGDLVDYTENIDGPGEPVGWLLPGFDDSAWSAATVLGRAPTAPWTHLVSVRTRIVEEPVPAVSLTTLGSGAVVADFGKVYAAVPTVAFHDGSANRLVTMRAGFLLDEPAPGQSFSGEPGQVSTTHGTQHTDMSYSYVQRGGEEQFHPFDYLGFRYFQIDDPGEALTPGDVVALARHTAAPDQPPAPSPRRSPRRRRASSWARHSALFTAQEQFLDTPTREKGPGSRTGSTNPRRPWPPRRAEPDPQVPHRVRPVPGPRTGPTAPSTRSTPRASGPRTSTSHRDLSRMGVAVLDAHRTTDPARVVYAVLRGSAGLHQRAPRPTTGLVTAAAVPGAVLPLPGGHEAEHPRGQRVPPYGRRRRGAGPTRQAR